jgi:hypothetical protein
MREKGSRELIYVEIYLLNELLSGNYGQVSTL